MKIHETSGLEGSFVIQSILTEPSGNYKKLLANE